MTDSITPIQFILASASPRRRELLGLLGYPFEVIVSGADEDAHLDAGPAAYVLHTARHKAETVARELPPAGDARRLIIAADTTVAIDGIILGKPATAHEARAMLVALRGREHDVHTAVCVVASDGREETSVHTAVVTMRDYSDVEIEAYIATGDPFDKAGGYAIQHPAFRPVAALAGCYLGVMGLSLCDLIPLLRRLGVADRFDPAALVDAHAGFLHRA
jgi:septum formation protein